MVSIKHPNRPNFLITLLIIVLGLSHSIGMSGTTRSDIQQAGLEVSWQLLLLTIHFGRQTYANAKTSSWFHTRFSKGQNGG